MTDIWPFYDYSPCEIGRDVEICCNDDASEYLDLVCPTMFKAREQFFVVSDHLVPVTGFFKHDQPCGLWPLMPWSQGHD